MAQPAAALKPAESSDGPPSSRERLYRERVVAAIREGLADIEAGRVVSDEDLSRELAAEFGPLTDE